jgi:hypothetical protein
MIRRASIIAIAIAGLSAGCSGDRAGRPSLDDPPVNGAAEAQKSFDQDFQQRSRDHLQRQDPDRHENVRNGSFQG